ncbi:hypothetical protein EBS67_12070 [bacterium]|nr:hypothetical protein [bacterium]
MSKSLLQSLLFLLLLGNVTHGGWPEDEVNYWDDIIINKSGISTKPKDIQNWLQSRIPNVTNGIKAAKWVADLGNESFEVREQASRELLKLNNLAIFELKKAIKSKDIEVAKRASDCLEQISPHESIALKTAIIRILGESNPELVFEYFIKIADTPELDILTSEALLDALSITIKSNPTLVQKLEDFAQTKDIKSRILIARVLAIGNPNGIAFRKLSTDDQAIVKANALLALLQEKDKKAIGLLITLLPELKTNQFSPIAGLLNELIQDQASEKELAKEKPSAVEVQKLFASAWEVKNASTNLNIYSLNQLQPKRILASLAEPNLSGKICSLNPDGSVRELFRNNSYADLACAINQSLFFLMERSRGHVIINNIGEIYERSDPLISTFGLDTDGLGKKFILNRKNLLVLDYTNKIIESIEVKNDCLAGVRLINGDYAIVFKDKSLLILDGKNLKKEKTKISLGVIEPTRTILGYQIQGTRSGSILIPEFGGKSVKEIDQTGKLIKTINLNISTGTSPIYGATLTMNSNGNFLIGTRLGQTVTELNLEGKEIRNWALESKLHRIFTQPLRMGA